MSTQKEFGFSVCETLKDLFRCLYCLERKNILLLYTSPLFAHQEANVSSILCLLSESSSILCLLSQSPFVSSCILSYKLLFKGLIVMVGCVTLTVAKTDLLEKKRCLSSV